MKHEDAYQDYCNGMKQREIAEKYNVTISAVKQWSRRDWKQSKGLQKRNQICNQQKKLQRQKVTKKKLIESVEINDELTEKRKLFCLYFADCLNATQAYIKAFNVRRTIAQVEGFRMLRIPKIKTEIDKLKQIKYDAIMLSAEDIVERQMRIAFADMNDFIDITTDESKVITAEGTIKLDENGKPVITKYNDLLVKESSEIDGAVIQEVKSTKDGLSIKLKDSQKAMDWLTMYFNLNPMSRHKKAYDNKMAELKERIVKQQEEGW